MTLLKLWGRDYTFHYVEACLKIFRTAWQDLPPQPSLFFFKDKGISYLFAEEKEINRFQQDILQKYAFNHSNCKKFLQDFQKIAQKYNGFGEKIAHQNLTKCKIEELRQFLEEYYPLWQEYTIHIWLIWNLSEIYPQQITQTIKEKAKRYGKTEKINQYLEFISTPSKKSGILTLQEKIERLKRSGQKINLKELFEEYQWLPWVDLQAQPWTMKDLEEYLAGHIGSSKKKISLSELKKEIHLTPKEVEMIKINQKIAYLRDYRDEIRRKTIYLVQPLYAETARRLKIDYGDLMFYSTPETLKLFSGKKLSPAELGKRKGDCFLFMKEDKLVVKSTAEEKELFEEINQEYSVSEVSGIVACPGKVQGKVKIVRLDQEVAKVEKGDIMVTVTTHPDYVPKMQIAKAIVTDDGGLTCHAAIVCREMNKPCLVGTKIATKVFKDGEVVEVNANLGIIKKIKNDS